MKKKILLLLVISSFSWSINAQSRKCGTMNHWEQLKEKDPNTEFRKQQLEIATQEWIDENKNKKTNGNIIYIPVVVHVLYHDNVENISTSQIESQIKILNADFRFLNKDTLVPSHVFWKHTRDTRIEFCLAKSDPNGNSTTGITRTFTDSVAFSGNGTEKYSATGGKDSWDPTKYLNIWICNFGESLTLGYATFPSDLENYPGDDGVVIRYEAFGNTGTAGTNGFGVNNLGRTATHEVGHWLNLSHIWGDEKCGDDFVSDTRPAEGENYNCPTFPHRGDNACTGSDADGEMFMNYMDYVDDNCMNMFTSGQSNRMNAAISKERSGLLNSNGCFPPTGIANLKNQSVEVNLFPNPSNGLFFVDVQSEVSTDIRITVINVLGEAVHQIVKTNVKSLDNFKIDMNTHSNGIYFVNITVGNETINKKVFLKN